MLLQVAKRTAIEVHKPLALCADKVEGVVFRFFGAKPVACALSFSEVVLYQNAFLGKLFDAPVYGCAGYAALL